MALMLAPYNEAMRLGMGFNSYTQQLCVNDVVRKPGGIQALETDLRAVQLQQGLQTGVGHSSKDVLDLTKSNGTTVLKRKDGQASISQVVSWEAKFVDNVSDILDSLKISGQLKISVDALGGGAGGGGDYLDSKQITKSDAAYSVTVKVTNQRLVAEEITEFTPIPNVPASAFNEVYGDSFISGFIEGGVFNAVVAIKKIDETTNKKMGGNLSINLTIANVAKVEGSAEGAKIDNNVDKKHTTTIMVNWSGGGDIKPDGMDKWDIPGMLQVAMEFPDAVAACPQKTFAILTKYSSLRSYREQAIRGSPLDYENAGIYTSTLLNAYMDYKTMWQDLQDLTRDLDKGHVRIKARETNQNLIEYGDKFKKDFENRIGKFKAAEKQLTTNIRGQQMITLEEPLPPTTVAPYEADIFGLENAKADCRFEMIKIVREANEVALDPKIATDPFRLWRYLSPNIFRMLLPGRDDEKKPLTAAEEAKLKQDLLKAIEDGNVSRLEAQKFKNEYEAIKMQQYEEREAWRKAGEEQKSQQIAADLKYEQELEQKRQKLAEEETEKQMREEDDAFQVALAVERQKLEEKRKQEEKIKKQKEDAELLARENARLEQERLQREGLEMEKAEKERLAKEEQLSKDEEERIKQQEADRLKAVEEQKSQTSEIEEERYQAQLAVQSGSLFGCGDLLTTTSVGSLEKLTQASPSPRIIFGLQIFGQESKYDLLARFQLHKITPHEFHTNFETIPSIQMFRHGATWMRIPNRPNLQIQSGQADTGSSPRDWRAPKPMNIAGEPQPEEIYSEVIFKTSYTQPPSVIVWLTEVDLPGLGEAKRISLEVRNITVSGFLLVFRTTGRSRIRSANAGWLAHQVNAAGISSGIVSSTIPSAAYQNHQVMIRSDIGMPSAFVGFCELDIPADSTIKLHVKVTKARWGRLGINLGSYVSTEANSQVCRYTRVRASYLAIKTLP